jgi:hypothetical protein
MDKASLDIFKAITASKNTVEMDQALASLKRLPKYEQVNIATALETNLRITANNLSYDDIENMKSQFAADQNADTATAQKSGLGDQVCAMASVFNKVAEIKGAQSSPFTKAVMALYQDLDQDAKSEPSSVLTVLKTASVKTNRVNPKAL